MTLLSKTTWAMQKENKRCLPKEGRPHAHGVCQKKRTKKRKDAYPKKVCHILVKAYQKKREENDDSRQLEITKEKESCKRVHP